MCETIRQVKRLIVAVTGLTVLAVGLAMIILPGPAIVVIPIGLGILATEFAWARRLLKKMRSKIQKKGNGCKNSQDSAVDEK